MRLPAPSDRLRLLLPDLPPDFVAALRAALHQAGPAGRFVRADVRRRMDGYFVELRFDGAAPAPGGELTLLLAPLLALPPHDAPPADLLTPAEYATGVMIA